MTRQIALAALCGLACSAVAQDSTSIHAGAPGDALDSYDTTEQCNEYVVDAAPFTGSWGTAFQIAPVLKATQLPNSDFYTNLISAQAISADVVTGSTFPSSSYSFWNAAGFGINAVDNTPPLFAVAPAGDNRQFGVGFAEFGTTADGESYNGVQAAVVNYTFCDEDRFLVTRRSTAVNGFNGGEDRSQFGFGMIDSDGNVHFRADDFGTSGPNAIIDNNIFRVRILDRTCSTLNVIDQSGGNDGFATDWLVVNNSDVQVVPNALPESLGTRPVYGGMTFATQYRYENTAGTTLTTNTYLQGATDSRGSNGISPRAWFNNTGAVATYGVLSKASGGDTDSISVWDVDANGAVVNPGALLTLPAAPGVGGSVIDNDDGFTIDSLGGNPGWELDGYRSQVPFRGGTGTCSLSVTPQGDRIAAATAYDLRIGGSDNPSNAVVVAKHDTSTGATTWTLAGYYDATVNQGKEILDGPGGAVIGEMTGLFNVTGGSPLGPSISGTSIDCAGNIYFVAAAELFLDNGASDFDVCLLRAVYDDATFSYELELVATTGNIFAGQNSATDYMLTFINLADSNSIDSGSFVGANVTHECWGAADQTDLSGSTDSRALGGLVLNARITYDTDGDGTFDNTLDENYRVALLITGTDACAYADFNNDGVTNISDFIAFNSAWAAGDAKADCNEDGIVDVLDFTCFLNEYNACQ